MSYTVRTRAQIRDSLLADWSARYHAAAETLLTIEGSPPYRWADALAVEIETLEAQAISLTLEIIPTTASDAGVLRHAAVDGVTQEPATAAVLSVTVRGVASSLITFGSAVLIAPGSGLRYAPSDETALTDGSGDAVVDFTCTTAGSEGNQSAGVELTWSSTPVFAEPTAVVVGTTVAGDDEESMESLARRIIERWQEAPASGNRADWRAWCEATASCEEAYVYSLLHPVYGADVPGSVTVVALGPVQGDSATNTRVLFAGALTAVRGYVEGTHDAAGDAATGTQLRPVTLASADYAIEAATATVQNVEATLVVAAAGAFPFAGTLTVDGTSSAGSLVVTGDQTAKAGLSVLVLVGTSAIRGGYQQVTLPTGSFSGGNTTFPMSPSLLGTPSGSVYPAPLNWSELRAAVFAYFDALGPGDTSPPSRWPSEETQGRATLYRHALAGALIDVIGVLDATINTPAANVAPAAKALLTLGTFVAHA
jgi:uncharacterized phage protein gp47/JayE